jgi:hypothetical protein
VAGPCSGLASLAAITRRMNAIVQDWSIFTASATEGGRIWTLCASLGVWFGFCLHFRNGGLVDLIAKVGPRSVVVEQKNFCKWKRCRTKTRLTLVQ